jgi:hypothetical protein
MPKKHFAGIIIGLSITGLVMIYMAFERVNVEKEIFDLRAQNRSATVEVSAAHAIEAQDVYTLGSHKNYKWGCRECGYVYWGYAEKSLICNQCFSQGGEHYLAYLGLQWQPTTSNR